MISQTRCVVAKIPASRAETTLRTVDGSRTAPSSTSLANIHSGRGAACRHIRHAARSTEGSSLVRIVRTTQHWQRTTFSMGMMELRTYRTARERFSEQHEHKPQPSCAIRPWLLIGGQRTIELGYAGRSVQWRSGDRGNEV